MPQFKSLGDRIKFYEKEFGENLACLMPMVPAVVRLDGKAFHTFTRGLARPFDTGLNALMVATTKYLAKETSAVIGHTFSDEISLILLQEHYTSQLYFDGRISKIISSLAALCTSFFTTLMADHIPSKVGLYPTFDCRCFSVPNKTEAVNTLVWRENDAVRNSIQMVAQNEFSHTRLHGLNCDELQELLWQERMINWGTISPQLRRGTYVRKTSPESEAQITGYAEVVLPTLTKMTNREAVIFEDAAPIIDSLA